MNKYIYIIPACLFIATSLLTAASKKYPNIPEPSHPTDAELLPKTIKDPIEPINRMSFWLNKVLFKYAVNPASKGYKWLIPKGGRKRVTNFHKNITYPVRLVNNGLQWQWQGAWVETKRFGVNSTVGFLGLNDPALAKYALRPSNEDLGQTFGAWGWNSQVYLFLPILGPNSERDALGMFGDAFIDPTTYYWPAKAFLSFNDIAGYSDKINDLLVQNYDPYELSHMLYSVSRQAAVDNYAHDNSKEAGAEVQTLRAIFAKPSNPNFKTQSIDSTVEIEGWKKPLPYSLWLQDSAAPLIIQIPGLGSFRKGNMDLALAELAYQEGYSVLIFSNTFNWEFMESAPKGYAPGFVDEDKDMMRVAYQAIMKDLDAKYSAERFQHRSLMGMSMGAWYTLNLAADLKERGATNYVDHCIAINPPVNLLQGLAALDGLYRAPYANGDLDEAKSIIDSAFAKAILSAGSGDLKPTSTLPFTDAEASYLIGFNFRMTLHTAIIAGGCDDQLNIFGSRGALYRDLAGISFEDYYKVLSSRKIALGEFTQADVDRSIDLRNREADLKDVDQLHLILSKNDFLLNSADHQWLNTTFKGKTTVFSQGGHLGEIWRPELQSEIRSLLKRHK